MPIQTKPNWQPLSLLPLVALMIDKIAQNAQDQHEALSGTQDGVCTLDDETIARAAQLYKVQIEDVRLYEEQLKRWQMQPLTGDQRGEVDRLLGQLPRIKQLSKAILEMLDKNAPAPSKGKLKETEPSDALSTSKDAP
jgi:hypothetical protein